MMPGTTLRQLFGVNVNEVSFVDMPAVPKAKLVLLKQLVSTDSEDTSLLPLVKAAEGRIGAIRSAMKAACVWDELSDDIKSDFAKLDAEIQTTSTAMHALDGIEKFYDDYDGVDSDAILLSDVNWASNMLISIKGTFDRLGDRVGEGASEMMGKINKTTLRSISDAAKLMVAVVEDIEAAAPVMTKAAGEDKTQKDDTVADETKPNETEPITAEVTSTGATLDDVLAAVSGLSSKLDDTNGRLTILETTGDGEPADAAAPETVADATTETVVDDGDGDDGDGDGDTDTVGLPTAAEIEQAVRLYPDMPPDEQKAVEELLQAVAEATGITPTEVVTSTEADAAGDGSDEAAAA